jgi:hypothetical protein
MTVPQNKGNAEYTAQYLQQKVNPDGRFNQWNLPLRSQGRKPIDATAIMVRKTVPNPMAVYANQQCQQMPARIPNGSLDKWNRLGYAKAMNKDRRKEFCADTPQVPLPDQADEKRNEQLNPKRFNGNCVCPEPQVKFDIRRNTAGHQGNSGQPPGKALQIDDSSRMCGSKGHKVLSHANYATSTPALKTKHWNNPIGKRVVLGIILFQFFGLFGGKLPVCISSGLCFA